ncbi:MAG: hypothetical protein ACRDTI_22615 [Mycobacterium sp.]
MQPKHIRRRRTALTLASVGFAAGLVLSVSTQTPRAPRAGGETPCHGQIFCPAGGTSPWLPYGTNPLVPWGTNPPVITYDPNSS